MDANLFVLVIDCSSFSTVKTYWNMRVILRSWRDFPSVIKPVKVTVSAPRRNNMLIFDQNLAEILRLVLVW